MPLYVLHLGGIQYDHRRNPPRVKALDTVGPVFAASLAEVEAYAPAAARRKFPHADELRYSVCAVPEAVLHEAATEAGYVRPVVSARKARRRERETETG